MIRYRISCVAGVFETEKTVFLSRCIRYVNRESKKSTSEVVDFVYKCTRRYTFNWTIRKAMSFISAFIDLCHFTKQNKVMSYRTYGKKGFQYESKTYIEDKRKKDVSPSLEYVKIYNRHAFFFNLNCYIC